MTTQKPTSKLKAGVKAALAQIEITNEQFVPSQRARAVSEYAPLFENLKFDQRIKCPVEFVDRVAKGLHTWILQNHPEIKRPVIRTRKQMDDGMGGVWWLEGETQKRTTKPQTTLAQDTKWFPKATAKGGNDASK